MKILCGICNESLWYIMILLRNNKLYNEIFCYVRIFMGYDLLFVFKL